MNKISTLLAVFFVLLVSSIAFAQERVITGKVTDSNKEPLPGATVLIKGTTMGTVADAEGEYRISVSKGATLIFSLLGYQTKEIAVQDQTRIEVALEEDSKMLSEVVVVGYAKQEVQSFSGASVQVAGKQNANGKPFKTWARSGINDNQLRVRVGDSDTLETRGVQV
ncbi:MAG: SusC/RagA family TonB-linked outer membrane protein, partial [Bacteroidetes bacterium]